MTAGRVLLLTGLPGVGKTTALRTVATLLAEWAPRERWRVGGFYTEEVRVRGVRRGFRGVTFAGAVRDIARVDRPGAPRVGTYGVDVAAVDALVDASLGDDRDIDVYLVDEIGRMECLSERFVAAMRRLLDGDTPLVATVAARGGGFIAEVKTRPDVTVLGVTRMDREAVPGAVLDWLTGDGARRARR